MKKIYTLVWITVLFSSITPLYVRSQNCSLLQANCTGFESRCAATGSIKVRASGGSGNYKYKTIGPVNTNFTSLDSITGLSAGTYTVQVNDIITNCTISIPNVIIAGSYQDPRFSLNKRDVTCDNGNNASISVTGQAFGRAPFLYTIVAPSPMGIGTSNSTGVFNGLRAGNYSIRLTDSCGGIQTRIVTINNYTWNIDAYPFSKTSCDVATGFIRVRDSRGQVSTSGGIPGFTYGIVRSPGDTIWSANPNFTFSLLGNQTFTVVARDACGIIKRAPVTVSLAPSLGSFVNQFQFACDGFSASLNNVQNFYGAEFCLYDASDTLISCNTTGTFTGIPYGSYCIKAHDACTGTIIQRCFSASPPPINVASAIAISNKTCTTFTASVQGQTGLTNPQYCLYDSGNVQLVCNSNGVFSNLSYGNYCIEIRDGCVDTTFIRCFTVTPPVPVLSAIVPVYINCVNFGIVVNADSITLPTYCLFDSSMVLIACNTTGVFDSIPLGNYCVTVHDSCTDSTLTQCFVVTPPIVSTVFGIHTSNLNCSTFSVGVSTVNSNIVEYCLYNSSDVLVSCNATGAFDNITYGSYCIKARLNCPDTVIQTCFIVYGAVPSVNGTVSISNQNCRTFTANITRHTNLTNFTNPQFCIYNQSNMLLACNSNGVFDDLLYGTYCIRIQDGCYDTVIVRCFTQNPPPLDIAVSGFKSCSIGFAQLSIVASSAVTPLNIKVYYRDGRLLLDRNFSNNNIYIDSVPGTTFGDYYKIVATDPCGNRDSGITRATASYINRTAAVQLKCPGGLWPNGSGNLILTARTNLGSLSVRVIKRNGVSYSTPLVPDWVSGAVNRFYDLGPGTYIVRTRENSCGRNVYDTLAITPYQFPNLNRSSAYQCDVNGFSISAIANNGLAPYLYEIIGSVPSLPAIVTSPQSNSIFNINNGSNYSLIRLRATDACGNATLGDASILPLANDGIVASSNCFMNPTTLSVDSIFGATYKWYKKRTSTSTDSTYLGSSSSWYVPMLTEADTGVYTCYLEVNAGCIKRTYHFNLNGLCYVVLPLQAQALLTGLRVGNKNQLKWSVLRQEGIMKYGVERRDASGNYRLINTVNVTGNVNSSGAYAWYDPYPPSGTQYYRISLYDARGIAGYSNSIVLNETEQRFKIFPNPISDAYTIIFPGKQSGAYKLLLYNAGNQVVQQVEYHTTGNGQLLMKRPKGIQPGLYLLRIITSDGMEQHVQQLIFQ